MLHDIDWRTTLEDADVEATEWQQSKTSCVGDAKDQVSPAEQRSTCFPHREAQAPEFKLK
eukprot:CAMPEP_0194772498 /NCGR_PEP_ID=MMETSP0323_2-20130528/52146_1 /TAXON_ID=2866 ORGANISM="Crypthecodinium cohnii, Strain Seligo" /NCGR_SAMPLE_ID=MMETSP0323_2 /ASSEMBLY_ACC=CAM_ASM_000346 /LENGTH=59 /DNA_ID=CAMNT_0039707049 /DNA_START=101 /DNA_END=280 /DNA_ORIENTATION=+